MFCSNVTYLKLAVLHSSGKKESFTFQLAGTSNQKLWRVYFYTTQISIFTCLLIVL